VVKDLYYFQEMAQEMVERDRGRDEMMAAMEQMWRGDWSLPPQMANLRWVHKVVSTDPHDALRSGMRVLSAVEPLIQVHQIGASEETRAQTDQVESALRWHFRQASRRRRANVLRDIVLSALLYDEIVAQVVYLPHQVEALKSFNGDSRRLEAAGRFGPFAILVRNPREVHVRYSDWMPEAVLMKRVMPAQEALEFWGKKAGKLRRALSETKAADLGYVTVYDYMDLEQRVVWCIPQ
jgi:hypothetical protein